MNLDHGYPRQNGGTDNLFSFESAFKFFVLQQELPLCGAPFPSQVNRSSELGSVFPHSYSQEFDVNMQQSLGHW